MSGIVAELYVQLKVGERDDRVNRSEGVEDRGGLRQSDGSTDTTEEVGGVEAGTRRLTHPGDAINFGRLLWVVVAAISVGLLTMLGRSERGCRRSRS